jgi:hypothetical protein
MNPKLQIESLSGVCNELDNVDTRRFFDLQCVRYGSKAHMQIVVPDITESYNSQQDPAEQGIRRYNNVGAR